MEVWKRKEAMRNHLTDSKKKRNSSTNQTTKIRYLQTLIYNTWKVCIAKYI
jgi:hypothetical protein